MVENVMNVIELWDISSAGNDVKLRIARESKQINTFVVINTSLILLWATQIMSSRDDSEGIFVHHVLDKLCPRQTNFYVVIFKVTYFAGLALQVHAYHSSIPHNTSNFKCICLMHSSKGWVVMLKVRKA
jgi:hypothetical protein